MPCRVHAHLATQDLLPAEHLLDAGYVDAGNLPAAQQDHRRGISWARWRVNTSWQAQTQQGFDIACFTIDWEAQAVTCPRGQRSRLWSPGQDAYGNEVIVVYFASAIVRTAPCASSARRLPRWPRHLKVHGRGQHEALSLDKRLVML